MMINLVILLYNADNQSLESLEDHEVFKLFSFRKGARRQGSGRVQLAAPPRVATTARDTHGRLCQVLSSPPTPPPVMAKAPRVQQDQRAPG